MTRFALALALLTAACTKGAGPSPADGSSPAPPATAGEAPVASAEAPAGEAPPSGELPAELNASTSSVAGCLASPGRTEQAPRARAMETKPELTVTPVAGGVRVAHAVSHACCLDSKVATSVSGNTVTITESLFGTPCRCMCSSTISTSVRLSPGDYTLRVVVDHDGQKTESEQKLVVK
ncbi:MAG: hypothetical protein KJ015_23100 [Myxococcales bacterium]|nr:hypothetical protein [Myxococcales bacterium]